MLHRTMNASLHRVRDELAMQKRERTLNAAQLLFYERGFTGTTLDDVTIEGHVMVDGNSVVYVEGDLMLNNIITLGDSTGYGFLDFLGSQTLGGSGTVTFDSGSGTNA